MLTKLATFRGVSPSGEPLVRLFEPGTSLIKEAGVLMPEIKQWMAGYKPQGNELAVLVNALGASEYWGQNVNGDVFPEAALIHDCRQHKDQAHPYDDFTGKIIPPYGYWTFLNAFPFVHHRNKDPSRAFGHVAFAVWNPRMHRVELIVIIDKALAMQHGAQDVVDRIMSGEYPDVSMGCRVPYDVCFPAGTPVLTSKGMRLIESIEKGATVFTHKRNYSSVEEVSKRLYHGSMVSLDVWGQHRPMVQTASHPIEVVREEQLRSCQGSVGGKKRRHTLNSAGCCTTCGRPVDLTTEWIEASDIQVGDYLVHPREQDSSSVKAGYAPSMAYLLGLYLGDGHVIQQRTGKGKTGEKKSVGIGITLGQDHPEVLSKLAEVGVRLHESGETDNHPRFYEQADRHAVVANIYGTHLAEEFEYFGGSGCREKFINEDAFGWKRESQLALIAGMIDSDGCQDHNGSLRVVGINEALMSDLRRLCLCAGIPATISSYMTTGKGYTGAQPVFQVAIPGSASVMLSDFSAKTRPVYRSSGTAAVVLEDRILVPVQGVEHYEEELEVYNLQVGEDQSYTAHGLSVHNCTICGNKSKTRNDYCTCVKQIGMGKILDDGRRIGVINCHPRFFDISFVFIGADKTAKVMCKLASGLVVPQSVAEADLLYGPETENPESGLVKAASKKPWYKSDLAQGALAGGVGGLASVGLFKLFKKDFSKGALKEVAKAMSEGGIAGSAGAGFVSALNKKGSVAPVLTTSDVEEARFPDTKAVRKKLNEEVLDRVMGRTQGGVEVDEKTAGLKDLKSAAKLFENLVGKHVKARVGRRSIRIDKLLKKFGAEQPGSQHLLKTEEDPTDDADTRLLMGRIDNQESPTAIGDGVVHTNIFHNEGEDSAGVDRTSGFTEVPPSFPRQARYTQRPKVTSLTFPPPHDFRVQWSGDMGGDSTNLSKESFDVEGARKKLVDRKTGLSETFKRAKLIKIGPPPTPNRKDYPFVGTIEFKGLTIHVENKPGDTRMGRNGKWQTLMHLPYGEILGTRGVDGDKLDVYVGPWRDAENAYIVHQNFVGGPKDGKYDEDKVMLGFDSPEQARAAYLAHYNNPKFFRSVTVMAFPLFKRAILRKEAQGEKLASAWGGVISDMMMEDEFSAREQEAPMEKNAAGLEDLFSGAATARRRQRTWRDKVTGRETNVTGSGMENSDKAKTASVDIETVKTARVLHSGWSLEDLLKVSNETKAAAHLKWADIVKCIGPSKAVGRVTPLLSQTEPNLPAEVLNKLGEDKDLKKSLTTPALMGMVLKPHEFQRIILIHIGKPDVADKLDDAGEVFKPSDESMAPCEPLEPGQFDEHLLKTLLPFLEGKSYTGPVVRRRIVRIIMSKPASHPEPTEVDSPLLSKVSSAYTWYRKEIMKLASALPATVTSHPELHARTLGVSTEDLFSKTAAGDVGVDRRTLAILLGTVPLSLLYSAHKRQQMEQGEDIGLLAALVAAHPWLTSMGVVTGLGALLRNPRAQQAVDEAFAAGGRVWRGKQVPASA